MWFGIVSLFPEMFEALTKYGVVGRAVQDQKIHIQCFNPRDHALDKHKTVDDRPYGGGPGMVMKLEPLLAAVDAAKAQAQQLFPNTPAKVLLLSPQGQPLKQGHLVEWATNLSTKPEPLILVSGRYEGIDERFIELAVDLEYSIGDYVLTGGELPAMVLLDALIRLLPGILGCEASTQEESFNEDLLDCPHYTRPVSYQGLQVPDVLLSGNHQAIQNWRRQERLKRTAKRRPDLNRG
ncbi:MAG: tRNA (guanosine(37)-N1)-methyltransferase TrmD [Gammaproteobacteria bacterium]